MPAAAPYVYDPRSNTDYQHSSLSKTPYLGMTVGELAGQATDLVAGSASAPAELGGSAIAGGMKGFSRATAVAKDTTTMGRAVGEAAAGKARSVSALAAPESTIAGEKSLAKSLGRPKYRPTLKNTTDYTSKIMNTCRYTGVRALNRQVYHQIANTSMSTSHPLLRTLCKKKQSPHSKQACITQVCLVQLDVKQTRQWKKCLECILTPKYI